MINFDAHFWITILFAFISSMIPALIWLYFWTREDCENPEPKNMLALAFAGGMVAVFLSLFLEKYFFDLGLNNIIESSIFSKIIPWFNNLAEQASLPLDKVLLVVIFAPIIEEIIKFLMAYILVLRSKDDDEPVDPMIYMITTALGFTAVENMLFLITPLINNNFIMSIYTGNLRFIGATLLHIISSATVAVFLSFHFFDSKLKKIFFVATGIIFSIVMHGIFNFLMVGDQKSSTMALELIWIIVIILLLAFEKIKKIRLGQIN